jgi:hypothetical protein
MMYFFQAFPRTAAGSSVARTLGYDDHDSGRLVPPVQNYRYLCTRRRCVTVEHMTIEVVGLRVGIVR